MASLNKKEKIYTHEGGKAKHINAEQALSRSVLSCLLWEKEFYEDGQEIAKRISELASQVDPSYVAALAIEARHNMNLRHVPLLLLSILAKTGGTIVGDTIEKVVSRADELAELLAVYAQVNGVTPDKIKPKLSAQVKKGLAKAFHKFDEYALGKYNRDGAIKLRDVMFLCHPKPRNEEEAALYKRLANNELAIPDTWEVALSSGTDKKATWERLIKENKLGYLALLRNLRNMEQAGVDHACIKEAIMKRSGANRVLPFRFIAAARHAPWAERELDEAMIAGLSELPEFRGNTAVLVDVSGSMDWKLSEKSDMKRLDAAAGLASIINAKNLRVFTFSNNIVEVAPRRGMAGVDAVINSQSHGGTYLGKAVEEMNKLPLDRLIVITDEQSHDRVIDPLATNAYMINVASNKNGVGYGRWTHIDGFSENIIKYIHMTEM